MTWRDEDAEAEQKAFERGRREERERIVSVVRRIKADAWDRVSAGIVNPLKIYRRACNDILAALEEPKS